MRNAYLQQCDYGSRFRILKGGKISLVVSALIASTTLLHANPSGGVVTSGSASIAQSGAVTNITQSTNKAAINWNSFSISSSETVNFNQPSVSSITLNRVVGNEKSIIDGALNANGQVFLLNSNGVLFSKNASINTAGLVATTMNLSDTDFMNGNYHFSGDSQASIINQGTINISDKGYAALFGKEVVNEGIIKATLGKVHLSGASEVTLNLNGNSLVNLTVNKGVLDALVENKGAIYADGGDIYLTTNAVNELLRGVVNNTGVIEANSIDDITGKIELYAHGGALHVSGTLEAKEGFIETSGKTLHVSDETSIKAKEWLIDPTDITVESTGSTTDLTSSSVKASFIESTLNTGTGVTLTADNSITVNEDITWSTTSQLTLNATNTITLNATIANTNTINGGVYFHAANTTDKVIFGTNGKVIIYNPYQLQWMNTALAGKYELGGTIDASDTSTWNTGAGFVPIGNNSTKFTGSFDGLGHTIDALSINLPLTDYVGLFGFTGTSAIIQNIGLSNVNITGRIAVGGLVGSNDHGTITNAYAIGEVSGAGYDVGGLVGDNDHGTITNAYAIGEVSGASNDVGGLVGGNSGTITNAYATGEVSGKNYFVGGLVGSNIGTITNAYATGEVSGTSDVGGLVGHNSGGTITNAYATGEVSGTRSVGGLVGHNSGTITNAYAIGEVSGTSGVGGLVGSNSGTISHSFWDTQTSHQSTSAGWGAGITTAEAFTQSTYTFDNFDTYWYMIDGYTRPFLRSEYATTISNNHQLQLMAMNVSASYTLTKDITYVNDGMWNSEAGFVPIGSSSTVFSGSFDGLGHTIDALSINLPSTDNVGLFGFTGAGSTLQNIGLSNVNITGEYYIGGLVGWNDGGTITNAYAIGEVSGTSDVGGLVGVINNGTIANAYAIGEVSGTNEVIGGLVGYNYHGTITNAYATGEVSGTNSVGGLVGYNDHGTITNAYATGEVSGTRSVGGLVGINSSGGIISNSFWDTQTSGQPTVGVGLGDTTGVSGKTTAELKLFSTFDNAGWDVGVGTSETPSLSMGGTHAWTMSPETVSYSLSDISNTYKGTAYTLSNLWSASTLFGSSHSTWALGTDYNFLDNSGNVVTSYTNAGTYSNLHIEILRNGYNEASSGNTAGKLTITKKALTVTANNASKTYDGLAYSGGNGVSYSGFVNGETASVLSGSPTYSGTSQSATNAGSYVITPSGLSSGNYTLSFEDGALTIDKRPVNISVSKTHDGSADFTTGFILGNIVSGETVSIDSGSTTVSSANTGSYTSFATNTLSLSDTSNYTLAGGTVSATINPSGPTAEELATAEAARLAAIEAARLAAIEAARVEAERLAAIEAARIAAEAEAARLAAIEAARVEAERLAAIEAARVEAERLAAIEAARIAAEAEVARLAAIEAARVEAERLAAIEAARITAEVQTIATQIVNGTATTPPVLPTFTSPNTSLFQFSNNGQTYDVFLQPIAGIETQEMSLQELSRLMGIQSSSVRIPLLQGVLLNFTQGGVNLPDGLEQVFYIAQR